MYSPVSSLLYCVLNLNNRYRSPRTVPVYGTTEAEKTAIDNARMKVQVISTEMHKNLNSARICFVNATYIMAGYTEAHFITPKEASDFYLTLGLQCTLLINLEMIISQCI